MGSTLIERLAAVPEVASEGRAFSISPDGETVAFEWRQGGDWQVFTVDSWGRTAPRRLVEIDDPCGAPKYSRDGRYLYFARDDRGSECYDIYRYDLTSGDCENLLPDTPDLSISVDFDLSPDGTRLAFSMDHGESYAAAVMPAAASPRGEAIRLLAEHYYNDWAPDWSPDGRHIAFQCDTHGQDAAVFIADVDGGAMRAIGGDDPVLAWHPRWSPDGTRIAFTGVLHDRYAIGVYDVGLDTIEWAWDGDRDAHHPVWSPDGHGLVFLTDHEAETALRHLDLTTDKVTTLNVGRGNHYHPRFTPDGSAVIVVLSGPGVPADLFRVEVADGRVTRLTHGLPDDLADHRFVTGEHVRYRSLDRLADVPALVFRPAKHNGSGVVIVHGGPTWHHSNEWDPLRDAFLAAGCMVDPPQLPRQRRLRPHLAARQPLPRRPGRDPGRGRRPRLSGRPGLRPGAHRLHRRQLGRLPHDGPPHPVPATSGPAGSPMCRSSTSSGPSRTRRCAPTWSGGTRRTAAIS